MQFLRSIPRPGSFAACIPGVFLGCAVVLPLFAAQAQTTPAARSHSEAEPAPSTPAAAPVPLSAAAPEPATVALSNGQLTVTAKNSDLTAILQQIAHTSGMSIEGLGKSTRVFGVYGPGNPRDVLTSLLAGSGYNFVMLGGAVGNAPAKLVLSEKTAGPLPSARPASASADDNSDVDSDAADDEPLGPGAIPHPSPQLTDTTDPQTRSVRNLDRLQQMQDQMQQQQNNPQ
jgi:hypothetical protein